MFKTKTEKFGTPVSGKEFWSLGFRSFGIVSDFGFRYSDLQNGENFLRAFLGKFSYYQLLSNTEDSVRARYGKKDSKSRMRKKASMA
jgi:hypothetical protein